MIDFCLEPVTWAVVHDGAPVLVIGPCSEAEALETTDVLLAGMPVEPGEYWALREARP